MFATVIITIALVVTVVALMAAAYRLVGRRERLRQTYGPEYDRVVAAHDDRRAAERTLSDRLRWYKGLGITEVDDAGRRRFADAWTSVQERFVDAPADALRAADGLVTSVLRERHFPVDSPDQISDALSVHHSGVLGDYRTATEGLSQASAPDAGGHVSTEHLRRALLAYRRTLAALLGGTPKRHEAPEPMAA